MRKKFALLLLITSLFTLNTFAVTFPEGIKRIKDKGTLVVGMHIRDEPPFFMRDKSGELIGYDVELAKYLAKQLNVKVEFNREAKTFDDLVDMVNEKKVDIAISLITPTLYRAERVRFTTPYLYLTQALLYNRLAAAKYKLADPANQVNKIPGIKIGVLKASAYEDFAEENFPNATIVSYDNLADGMQDVVKGKIFAVFSHLTEIEQWLDKQPDAHLYAGVSKLVNKIDPIAIAVPYEYPNLLAWLDVALDLIKLEHYEDKFKKDYFTKLSL